MLDLQMTAVILGPKSGSDRWYKFSMNRDPDSVPADEVVECFMSHLTEIDELPNSNAYELNSAIRSKEQNVVMSLGTLFFSNEPCPLVWVEPLQRPFL